jgi:FlaA1/EpsC-like NDP-sugar epimerase
MRNRHVFLLDVLAMVSMPAVALTLRLERLDWWQDFGQALLLYVAVALVFKLIVFHRLGLYRRYWRHASPGDLAQVLLAVGISTVILVGAFVVAQASLGQYGLVVPRSLPLLDGMLSLLAVVGSRSGIRVLHSWHRQRNGVIGGRRVLVVGAGEAGTTAVREMRSNPQLELEPVAFADDDPAKLGAYMEGLQVSGTCDEIPDLIERYQIQRIIVAIPSAPLQRQREIIDLCEGTGMATHNLPGIYEILAGHKTLSRLPRIDINRLLHREPVAIDQSEVAACLGGATVLVTGAGGSIGSELCRQIARLNPAELILLGHGENSIVEINLDLHLSFPDLVTRQVIADIRDHWRIRQVVGDCQPDVIFHAAAHKHVPLMEEGAEEAITNNVLGTSNVLRAAEHCGVDRFLLISTDKAVNPTCVMGATKRLAEVLVVAAARRSGRPYAAVRFGNVLGSRGSVVPVFQRQIAAGGPLTITHPDMCRYFMTIPEAVQLVLQAVVLGQGAEIFVLDMGQPVQIRDLATNLIRLSGLEPERDIKIVYTGIRPGEKLREELFLERERCRRTRCSKISVTTYDASEAHKALERVVMGVVELVQKTRSQRDSEQLRTLLLATCRYVDNDLLRLETPQPELWPSRPSPVPMAVSPAESSAQAA